MTRILLCLLLAAVSLSAQFPTPLERSGYTKLTTNAELVEYVTMVDDAVPFIRTETMALSTGGKSIPAVIVSTGGNTKKLTVLIFAQQHGNEPSGKEGALMLLRDIAGGKLDQVLASVDLVLVPQMNPDGNDINIRRNGRGMDLNRNHLIMTEPEVIGLHELALRYAPDVTLDVHEYSPWGETWKAWGYRENADETYGTMTNINTSAVLRTMQKKEFLPFIETFLAERGFSYLEYNVGGPPNVERIRNSTVDINDGRQSFGILGAFSMIQEGMNGRDSIDNIKHRSEGQCAAMTGYLTFAAKNAERIRAEVAKARAEVKKPKKVHIQMEHVFEAPREQRYFSYASQRETTLVLTNYHTKVEPRLTVEQPKGYLVPKSDTLLADFLAKHHIVHTAYAPKKKEKVMQYRVTYGTKPVFEEFELPVSAAVKEEVKGVKGAEYWFVPVTQPHSTMLTLALEPHSMINLLQYERFAHLMKDPLYPVLRVE